MADNTPERSSREAKGIYFDVKKKPYDIKIDNNKKEPKLSKNVRYTDKQNYRRYKTLTEPKLLSRIMVDANDSQTLDVGEQIQRLLGIKPPPKKDERLGEGEDVFTAPSAYIEPPNPRAARIEPRIEPRAEPEPRAEARPRPAFVEPDEEIAEPILPAAGYRFTGARISTSLIDGLSDVSSAESEEILGAINEDDKSDTLSELYEKLDKEFNSIIGDTEEESRLKLQAAARGKLARDNYLKQKDASNKITNAFREYKSKKPEPTPSVVSGADTTAGHIEKPRGRPPGSYGQNRRHQIAVEAIKQKKARNVDAESFKVDRALYTSAFGKQYMNFDPKKGFKLPP